MNHPPIEQESLGRLMLEAVVLARRGVGQVEPNPPVGALVVRDGKIVGRGWHSYYGGPHAEVEALRSAGEQARGATLLVTLEPCSTHRKTPPCTDAILEAGIRAVVIGAGDLDPRNARTGVEILKSRGVEVVGPIADASAEALLVRFREHLELERPYVVCKWAMTLDGKIATRSGDSRWISGEESRALVHQWRGRVDGIVVGSGTVKADLPRLTARPPGPLLATRVVLDRSLSTPLGWPALEDGGTPVLLVHDSNADPERVRRLQAAGAETLEIAAEDQFLRQTLKTLRARGLRRLLVEGGSGLLGAFHDEKVVDQIMVFVGPKLFGGDLAPSAVAGIGRERVAESVEFEAASWRTLGDDAVFEAMIRH